MFKPIAIAALLATAGSSVAYAQSPPAHPPASTSNSTTAMPADASKMIGRNVQNKQNETVGEITSIYLSKNGKVDSVMIGVGGFLGMGEREIKVAWKDLKVSDGGSKVTIDMTKDQLKAQAPYTYPDKKYRGTVFGDNGIRLGGNMAMNTADHSTAGTTDHSAAATVSTGDFNADGQMSANAIVGANVKNANNDTVGTVEDAYLDKDGKIKKLIVSVGGFLGMGTKDVAVNWSDVNFSRDNKSVVLKTTWTKDSLKAMPDYKYERRMPASNAKKS